MDEEVKLFDRRQSFPDLTAANRLGQLVGVEEARNTLKRSLGILINPANLKEWGETFHKDAKTILTYTQRRPPLIILAGDVGTGKTELAETIGDDVARQEGIGVTLLPLSLSTRGSGRVGEMTTLLSSAFEEAFKEAQRLSGEGKKSKGGIILLVDEADALTQSRENAQMHHEDRAGVNAFIRGVDRLAQQHLPAAVILCTNRLSSIDPAVRRRAAAIFEFTRPDEAQRLAVLSVPLKEVGFTDENIKQIVKLTGPKGKAKSGGFTYSDLTQRLLPTLIIDAYPDGPVTYKRAVEIIKKMKPTPEFKG